MRILIPTHMREEKQVCWESLPIELRSRVTLCARSDRVSILQSHYPEADIIDIGETDGIADVRQRLVDHVLDLGEEKLLIVDDNCTFMKRDENLKLSRITEVSDYEEMFARVENLLDDYAWVGISDRAGNNRVEESTKENTRSYSCYGINCKMMDKEGIRFDGMWRENPEIKLFEDFYVILSLLSAGKKNIVIYDYAFNHPHGKPGGNSTFRTNEVQEKCYKYLAARFPGLVKLKMKENASWTTDENSTGRLEAQISWKKAYEQSTVADVSEFFG